MALDEAAKQRALAMTARAATQFAGAAAGGRVAPEAPRRPTPRFEDLDGFKEIASMRRFGEALGVPDPFFRSHEGRSGATAMIDGREVLNFASYDYIGVNGDPRIAEAAKDAIDRFGVSVSASRPTAGERPFYAAFEADLADFTGAEKALTFVSGHATNVSAIATLVGPKDLLIVDELSHNSIMVGAQLSGAARRSFAHNDLDALRAILERDREKFRNALIVVEGVYSMDGDHPDLAGLVALKREFGAWLMVDEAHALGVLGARGSGLAEHAGVDAREVDVWMGTLGKALASCGGYIAGSEALIDLLRFKAPGFMYSVGAPPAIVAAAHGALSILRAEPERARRVQAVGERLLEGLRAAGVDTGHSVGAAVVPAMLGGSLRAVIAAERLLEAGVNAFPIVHPAVPEKAARLRFFVTASHTDAQIDQAIAALTAVLEGLPANDAALLESLGER
ncbi:MAG: aminotransferase class I/II-fold pyridoxal phosphate-dependent enzyme [Pseudomonadota bacterium]